MSVETFFFACTCPRELPRRWRPRMEQRRCSTVVVVKHDPRKVVLESFQISNTFKNDPLPLKNRKAALPGLRSGASGAFNQAFAK
jgi:hypothetical protein